MDNENASGSSGHLLQSVPGIEAAVIEPLKKQWIETAEQFLAISASPEGRTGLKTLLGLDDEKMDQLIGRLRDCVGPVEEQRLCQPIPGGPLGALLTEEQKRKFGVK